MRIVVIISLLTIATGYAQVSEEVHELKRKFEAKIDEVTSPVKDAYVAQLNQLLRKAQFNNDSVAEALIASELELYGKSIELTDVSDQLEEILPGRIYEWIPEDRRYIKFGSGRSKIVDSQGKEIKGAAWLDATFRQVEPGVVELVRKNKKEIVALRFSKDGMTYERNGRSSPLKLYSRP